MANQEQLEILKQGVEVWNMWRKQNSVFVVDLTGASLSNRELLGINLSMSDLTGAELIRTDLSGSKLLGTNFTSAILTESNIDNALAIGAKFIQSDLRGAYLLGSNFYLADFTSANLMSAKLQGSSFRETNFSGSNLSGTDLQNATFIETNLEQAILTNCKIYGISAWRLKGEPTIQSNLIITPDKETKIKVDNLHLAQFIYLLLNNKNVKSIMTLSRLRLYLFWDVLRKNEKMYLMLFEEN